MKIQCDVCERAPATVICCADEAALCAKCDIEVHAANKLASKHQRLLLQCLSNKLPPCDICQEKAAFIFCVEDRALFCRDCDEPIHPAGSLAANHQRFLATGIRVALSSSCNKNTENNVLEPPNKSAPQTSMKMPAHQQHSSFSSPWAVDDLLELSDIQSLNKKEHSELGELEWLADIGLFGDQLPQEALAAAEVPQLPISQSSSTNLYRPTKYSMALKKPRIETPDEDDEFFTVPDLGNFFTGGIAGWINGLRNVESIDLSENLLSGPIPPRISELRRLTHISFSNNEFSGRIPDINGLWKLQTLDLGSNMFVGNLPKLPTKLRSLTLSHNQLSGHITSLGSLKELRYIDLSDNKFTGSITRSILSLPELNQLNVSFNQLASIEVNTHLGSGSPLQVLNAQRNRLQGHLPVSLVNFENLQEINLAYNGLTGRVPVAYGQRLGRPWKSLFLDDNFLSGRIPRQFNSSALRISGSLANNCLSCPVTIPICGGGQRPASACIGEIGNH
ncbi:hypothetical protein V6Z11_A09G241100 [Gossypium hirsutum]